MPLKNDDPIDTSALGVYTVRITATDDIGTVTTEYISYRGVSGN